MGLLQRSIARASAVLGRLGKNASGSVVTVAAIVMVPILIGVFGALDLSVRLSTYDAAQAALDAATLSAASSAEEDPQKLESIVTRSFDANVAHTSATEATVTAFDYQPASRTLSATASGRYHDVLSNVVGWADPNYDVNNVTLRRGVFSGEIVLVLDTTFSMSEPAVAGDPPKIDVLKSAAQSLASHLLGAQRSGMLKIAVVPYADAVNVGPNAAGNWISVPRSVDHCRVGTNYVSMDQCIAQSTSVCRSVTGPCTRDVDGVHFLATCTTTPTECRDSEKVTVTTDPVRWTTAFYGCVTALASGSTLLMPDAGVAYLGMSTSGIMCPEQIQPLTSDPVLIQAAISGLYVKNYWGYRGNTYIPLGLVWGVNVLSPQAPYTEAQPFDPRNFRPHKVMILMTDGQNDFALSPAGKLFSASAPSDLARTYADQRAVCNYAKAHSIEIFTIGFGIDENSPSGAQSLAALLNCATDAHHYFDARNAAALAQAFVDISSRISEVRVAQ